MAPGKSVIDKKHLIRIDPNTGAATDVGPFGPDCKDNIADIATSPNGNLFGWCEDFDGLVTLDTATGAATAVGDPGISTFGDAMSFDQTGTLWAALQGPRGPLYRVKTGSGQVEAGPTLNGGPYPGKHSVLPAGSFSCDGRTFYAVESVFAVSNGASATSLVTINTKTGRITTIGTTVTNLDALVWRCQK